MRRLRSLLLILILSCVGPTDPEPPYLVGVITQLRPDDPLRTMLVEQEPIGQPDPLCEKAAYFTLGSETQVYRLGSGRLGRDALAAGKTVSAELRGIRLDSCPPIYGAHRIFVH